MQVEATESDPSSLARLFELCSSLLEEKELAPTLRRIQEASVELLEADRAAVHLCREEPPTFQLISQIGFPSESLDFLRSHPIVLSFCQIALDRRQRLIVEDPAAGPAVPELAEAAAAHGFCGLQATPLYRSDGRPLAVLSTYAARRHPPSARDLGWFDLYVPPASRALEGRLRDTEFRRQAARLAHRTAQLQHANAALARSNEDLSRFAFAASHDLQEPLRAITVYAQLLARKVLAPADSEAALCVENIVSGAARMSDLLADLLAYCEVGATPPGSTETVDLNQVVETVRRNLQASIDESRASILADPLPVLSAHPTHLVRLLQNLVGNAIKYRNQRPPEIHISAQEADGQRRFAVSDNGIGIEPEHHEEIFQVFKRLHGGDIPGTGVGLAICQRVVEGYGGRIWVESRPGAGSTFFFTLPLAERHQGRG
jgi:signal transduction histidine kinase